MFTRKRGGSGAATCLSVILHLSVTVYPCIYTSPCIEFLQGMHIWGAVSVFIPYLWISIIHLCSDRERHAPCAIVPLKTEMSHRFLQWMRPGLFPIFTIIFGTK